MTVQIAQNQSNKTPAPIGSSNFVTFNTLGGGGGGSSGMYLTGTSSPQWSVSSTGTTQFQSTIKICPSDNGDAIIETNKHKINLDEFYKQTLDLLCMVMPDEKLHEQHPTLADAYENYKKISAERETKIDPELREAYKNYQALKVIFTEK